MKLELLLTIATTAMAMKQRDLHDERPFEYCYEPLNPLESARATRTVTNMFFACKKEWLDLNIRPSIIKEFDVFCIALRMCYSFAADKDAGIHSRVAVMLDCLDKLALAEITAKQDWADKYHFNFTTAMKSYRLTDGATARPPAAASSPIS
ncbi:uncharacterized protein LOC119385333 [Rhipicephalus sanguineus]|uniref:uncharacterized protein LOC119385333 n=1 Tax=Rhipicephalus sanguineus TaxID=34632 RepID=UPI001895B360|nr:uncharacterized protein LOC119385333 [Rhipicephalus sanguineus]